MSFKIESVGDVPPEAIVTFLESQQGTPADHTLWKYYDTTFNSGRCRGYAAIQDSTVVGLLGLIPFEATLGQKTFQTAWTCDWFVDAERASGATGIALLKAATSACDTLFHTGGGEVTKRLFGRLANVSENHAVQEYRSILRLGYLANRAKQRSSLLAGLPTGFADKISVRRKHQSDLDPTSLFTPGISDSLIQTLASSHFETDFHPIYDAEYLAWFGRNPGLDCYSCALKQCAALLWHPKQTHPRQTETEWRMAIVPGTAGTSELTELIGIAVDFAALQGADSVKALVSAKGTSGGQALEQSGFSESWELPFFAFYQAPDKMPQGSMSGLSFLDADNATLY